MPKIPPEIIEQIAAANDIVEVIGSYLPLKRAGSTFKTLCPFHRERSPSFVVNPQRQIFKCFGCGVGGSVFRFVMDYERVEFMEAVKKLAQRANIALPEAEMSAVDYQRADRRRRLLALHAVAADFFHACLLRTAAGEAARDYLKKRGLGVEVAKRWKLGFSPEAWDALLQHAQTQGFLADELAESGLFSKKAETGHLYDRFRGRIMFPICNDTGEVIAFSGRVLSAEQSPAKYVNSPETMLFTKGAVLFGLHQSKRALIEKKQAIVCEGQIDLITAFEAGVQNVIAPQGTAFTPRQARILKRYVEEVVLCFDSDAAGDKAAERSLPQLLAEGIAVRCAEMPPGEDPDSLIRTRGGAAFAQIIAGARDFFDYQLYRLTQRADFATPRGKIAAARRIAEFISLIPEAVARDVVLNDAAMRLLVAPEQLRALLQKPVAFSRTEEEDTALNSSTIEPIRLDATQQILLLLALRHPVARAWLQAQAWDRVLEDGTQGSALLMKVLDADFRTDDPASLAAWMGELRMEEEAALSSALEMDMPADGKLLAEEYWHGLERRELLRRRQAAETRLRSPGLTLEEQAHLHAQVLALHRQIASLPAPRPPRIEGL